MVGIVYPQTTVSLVWVYTPMIGVMYRQTAISLIWVFTTMVGVMNPSPTRLLVRL